MKRSPLKKKRSTPRRRGITCLTLGCKRRPATAGLCKTHATSKADKLVGNFVKGRDRGCVAAGKHAGPLQWAHVVSRRYRAVRWDPTNAVTLCAGHHMYFTPRPLEWDAWVIARIGADAYSALKRRALEDDVPDLANVINQYGGEA